MKGERSGRGGIYSLGCIGEKGDEAGSLLSDSGEAGTEGDEKKYLLENKNPDIIHPAVQKMSSSVVPKLLCYSPKDVLTEEEERELSLLRLSEMQRSALQKPIADSCASVFFHLFCLLDAIGAPEITAVDHWSRVMLVEGTDDSDLHDEFFASYWDYERINGR